MSQIERINLSKLPTCDQLWEDMTPNEQGRLCQKCNKTIIDFTKKTDREIAEIHTFSDEVVCGMYLPRQLRLDIPNNSYRRNSTLKPLLLSFFGLLTTSSGAVTGTVKATQFQVPVSQESINWTQSQVIDTVQPMRDSLIVYGMVRDHNGSPLPYCPVHIEGTRIGTNTNLEGKYFINVLPILMDTNRINLIFTHLGWHKQSIVITNEQFLDLAKLQLDIIILPSQKINNETINIISFKMRRSPWYKRIWYRIKNAFRSER